MAFSKKTWKDRVTEYPNRRTLTTLNGDNTVYTVSRNEGTITQKGDAFSASNMNDLEERIAKAVDKKVVSTVMTSSGWRSGKYSFESNYPHTKYSLSIEPDADRISSYQLDAWSSAQIVGSASKNEVKAFGTKPSTDIPIILTIEEV